MEGRAVYASKSYENARRIALRLMNRNKYCEIIVQLENIIYSI